MKRNNAYILGITGGVGSGKSLALDYLSDKYNCFLIKADDIGNEVKLKGHDCYDEIVNLFGEDILDENKEIIKNKMAEKIFADNELIEKVNDIIHPAVRKEIERIIGQNSDKKVIVIEAALLVEAKYFSILNELWEIQSDIDIRIKRLMSSRGYSKEKCESIILSQHDSSYYFEENLKYEKNAQREDYYGLRIINNNGTAKDLYMQIDKSMEEIYGRI